MVPERARVCVRAGWFVVSSLGVRRERWKMRLVLVLVCVCPLEN